jgi:hypothetical protein
MTSCLRRLINSADFFDPVIRHPPQLAKLQLGIVPILTAMIGKENTRAAF